ncbi:MAG: hypothetical protein DRQ78_09140 [Epsilonproteobacteria bacterium]|nr:MAG: hypothetical protein DRQ78_09140 [Campylobacterota bacterium]
MSLILDTIKKILKQWFVISGITIITILIYLVVHLVDAGDKSKALKADYAQIHSVQYGLFNSSIWANKISNVIDQKINSFDFNVNNRKEIKKYIETILDTLIVEADHIIRERNKKKKSFFDGILGSTKQMITDSLIDMKDLRERVPQFTDSVMDELEKPANQKILKKVLREKLKQLTKDNLATTDMSLYNKVLHKYKCQDFESCDVLLNTKLSKSSEEMEKCTLSILLLAAFLLLLIILQGRVLKSISLLLLSITSLTLLIPGLMLPMLDIEAKISKLYFTILDKPLTFHNQILFFQSKSISDLVNLLLESDELKMIFVGILLTTFSIIFPSLKLISTYIYFYGKGFFANNAIIRFFALRSTKWSMADVMVVSIFMAYLGLDGVIANELKTLEEKSIPINVITTNGTHLEVGFFLFLGFVLSSYVLSILAEKSKK